MIISTPQGNIELTNILDESYRYRQLMGENYVELKLLVPEYIEVPVGSTIALGADVYTLLEPQKVVKNSSRSYEISLRFDGAEASTVEYCNISDSKVTQARRLLAKNSVNGGNNQNWGFDTTPPLALNFGQVDKMYLGSSQVVAAYFGETKIF